jgi:hypothetical protein
MKCNINAINGKDNNMARDLWSLAPHLNYKKFLNMPPLAQ